MKPAELDAPKRPTLTAHVSMFPIASFSPGTFSPLGAGELFPGQDPLPSGPRECDPLEGVGCEGDSVLSRLLFEVKLHASGVPLFKQGPHSAQRQLSAPESVKDVSRTHLGVHHRILLSSIGKAHTQLWFFGVWGGEDQQLNRS
jgi:hypothetical protein